MSSSDSSKEDSAQDSDKSVPSVDKSPPTEPLTSILIDPKSPKRRPSTGLRTSFEEPRPLPDREDQDQVQWLAPAVTFVLVMLIAICVTLLVFNRRLMANSQRQQRPSEISQAMMHEGLKRRTQAVTNPPTPRTSRSSSSSVRPLPTMPATRPGARAAYLKFAFQTDARRGGNLCFASGSVWPLGGSPEKHIQSVGEPASQCDVIVHCCRLLSSDMTVSDDTSHLSGAPFRNHSARSVLLGLRGPDSTFAKLLDRHVSERSRFLRNIVAYTKQHGFNGVRLWWNKAPAFNTRKLSAPLRDMASKLRQANVSLGLFLPYTHVAGQRYADKVSQLRHVLGGPHTLLLYPTGRMFRNASRWPSPVELAAVSMYTAARSREKQSFCYLLSPQPVSMALMEACNEKHVQKAYNVTEPGASAACGRSSWYPDSWKTHIHKYYTYACKGRRGTLFQTDAQVQTFRRKLLDLTQSSCIGVYKTVAADCS